MRVIIMADGKGSRWGQHTGKTKHFIEIDGEPILERTVRLLRERGVDDIFITTHYDFYAQAGAQLYAPENNDEEIDKFLAPHPIWKGETLMLYGDCYFTEEAINTILSVPCRRFVFFGRYQGSELTGKRYGEIFALKFKDHDLIKGACQEIRDNLDDERYGRGAAWTLYRLLTGVPLLKHELNGSFVEINDLTDDFDTPKDLEAWLKGRELSTAPSTLPHQ